MKIFEEHHFRVLQNELRSWFVSNVIWMLGWFLEYPFGEFVVSRLDWVCLMGPDYTSKRLCWELYSAGSIRSWILVTGFYREEKKMFWRDREREIKDQNGGPPCGQVRVLVVGDSGLFYFWSLLWYSAYFGIPIGFSGLL